MKKYFAILLFCLSFAETFNAYANTVPPSVTEHTINGFRVLLINHHHGNGVQLGVHVDTGSWHDHPTYHAGRAHLWEHVIHSGTKSFPNGFADWQAVMKRLGGQGNAYTANDRTYYHMYGHPDAIADAIAFIGSQISEPLWDEAKFKAEKAVVMDEALQYQANDATVLESGMLLMLLPMRHPLGMYDVGTQQQLTKMDLSDLQDLYYSNYKPGLVTIMVAGNFDSDAGGVKALNAPNILKLIGQRFVPAQDPRPSPKDPRLFVASNTKVFPSLFEQPVTQSQVAEISTQTETKALQLMFEIPTDLVLHNNEALETFLDYLNLSADGSLAHALREKGWINSISFRTETINNLSVLRANISLTEEGAKNRFQIPTEIFSSVREVEAHGIPQDVLEYIRRRNISSYTLQSTSASHSPEMIAKYFKIYSHPHMLFNFKDRFGRISQTDMKQIARDTFRPEKMLMGYIGNDVQASESFVPVFWRPAKTIRSSELLQEWIEARNKCVNCAPTYQPQLSVVPVSFSDAPRAGISAPLKKLSSLSAGTTAHIQENHDTNLGALVVHLQSRVPDIRTVAARNLFWHALNLHYRSELEYLSGAPIGINFQPSTKGWKFHVSGNSQASLETLVWLLKNAQTFKPTPEEVAQARSAIIAGFARKQSGFSAQMSNAIAQTLFNTTAYQAEDVIALVKTLKPEDVSAAIASDWTHADLSMVLVGDYTAAVATELSQTLRGLVPEALTSAEQDEWTKTALDPIADTLTVWKQMPANKDDGDIGHTRVLHGATLGTRKEAAVRVLQQVLSSQAFLINRSRKSLGYMHGAGLVLGATTMNLTLHGETGVMARWHEIAEGYDEIRDLALAGQLNAKDITDAILGLGRGEQLLPESAGELAEQIFGALQTYGNPETRDAVVKLIQELKPEEVLSVAQEVFKLPPAADVMTSRNQPQGCANLLTPAAAQAKTAQIGK